VKRLLKFGVIYFALVFGAGFILGPIRVLWLVPRMGQRLAELVETPVMLVVIILSARWVVRRLAVPATPSQRLTVGLVALVLLGICEFTVVLWLRGLSIAEYFAGRDPVAGAVYLVMLGLFAAMPLLLVRKSSLHSTDTSLPSGKTR
jgi:hypothetical protein